MNIVNGKSYIGWTSKTIEKRWKRHLERSRLSNKPNHAFINAIIKYGENNFEHEIIEIMTTIAGAKKAEQLWIKKLNTKIPNGYNMTDGGDGTIGIKYSEEHKRKLSEARFGKKLNEETRKRMSENHIGMLGMSHSKESRKKMSDAHTKRHNKFTLEKELHIIDLYKKNISIEHILKNTGIGSCHTIYRILDKYNISRKGKGHNGLHLASQCSHEKN